MWKREGKIVVAAILLIASLTLLYAVRVGVSPLEVAGQYLTVIGGLSTSSDSAFTGSTEIKPLLIWLAGGGTTGATYLFAIMLLASLVSLAIVFYRRPESEPFHLAILSLFALWSVYHRTYDSVLYMIPVALLIDLLVHKKAQTFSRFWLAATGLLILSLPGLLTSRLGVPEDVLAQSIGGFLAVHIERLLTIGMFVSLLIFLWRTRAGIEGREEEGEKGRKGEGEERIGKRIVRQTE